MELIISTFFLYVFAFFFYKMMNSFGPVICFHCIFFFYKFTLISFVCLLPYLLNSFSYSSGKLPFHKRSALSSQTTPSCLQPQPQTFVSLEVPRSARYRKALLAYTPFFTKVVAHPTSDNAHLLPE